MRLSFLDAAGARLLHEPNDGGMSTERVRDGSARRVRACFAFAGEQHFYGLGQGGRELDRLGTARQLWNTQLGHGPGSDMGVPLLLSHRGYGLFFDNTSDAVLAVGRSDNGVRIVYTAEAGRLTWYFLRGPDLRGVMGEVAELLGRSSLPLWQRLLGRPASESGRLCHGDRAPRTGRAPPEGANVAYAPGPPMSHGDF